MNALKLIFILALLPFTLQTKAQGYICGDFHQHSTYTDGSWNISTVFEKEQYYQLDFFVNSEHGGQSARYGAMSGWITSNGTLVKSEIKWSDMNLTQSNQLLKLNDVGQMWRWQTIKYFSFSDILKARKIFPDKLIIQGVEWNVPGHEHANTAIISNQFDPKPNADGVAEFEFKFDRGDHDTEGCCGWVKSGKKDHEKAIEGIQWMQQHHKDQSWVVPTHPERKRMYTIADLRDMNNAGPAVCFGFDAQPGHQKDPNRGGFSENSYGKTTYGGTGYMAAKIGGVWDAMLSEGRHWWAFANSDFHDTKNDFFPGEYQRTYTFVEKKNDAASLVKGLQSGNSFFVTGQLIDSLDFTMDGATMGQLHNVKKGQEVTIRIMVRTPKGPNFNTYSDYTKPEIDHIDLIAGYTTSKIDPATKEYQVDSVLTTKVIARFGGSAQKDANNLVTQSWTDNNGNKVMSFKMKIRQGMYFRLRGTNHKISTPGQTDAVGNPLPDEFGKNNASEAFSDLWFYSNPIFVGVE